MKKTTPRSFALGLMLIPLNDSKGWQTEKFAKIAAHQLDFLQDGLHIKVNESASPIFYPLPEKTTISSFKIEGSFLGLPQFKDPSLQGSKGYDDYALRLGFILPGSKTLSTLEELFAPAWIKNIYKRIPIGMGLDHVKFFNITQNPVQMGTQRTHPATDYLQENFIGLTTKSGPFSYEYKSKTPFSAFAIWISCDGDDTHSRYEVLLNKLEMTTSP